jgi:hypothetical protein
MLEMYDQYANHSQLLAVHFSDLQNLQPKELLLYSDRYIKSDKRNIWVCHFDEYLIANHSIEQPIRTLPNKIFCLFTSPSIDSLAFKRMYVGPWAGKREFMQPEYYTPEVFCDFKHSLAQKIDPKRVFTMDTEKFFLSYDYLSTTLYDNLGIELPEICRLFHHLWLEHAKKYVEEKELDFNSEYVYTYREL